jgi:hypothetical protein
MLEDATGDFLIFLECLTYPGLGWPDVACTSMAPEEFLVAQTPSGRARGVLLPRALVEEVGLPPEINLNALLKRFLYLPAAHAVVKLGSRGSWRSNRCT